MATAAEIMASLGWGTELETVGLGREACARTIQTVVGGEVYQEAAYDAWCCKATDGRVWKCVRDGSLTMGLASAEVVTPILHLADMPTLQAVVRALRAAGAKVDSSCSQHVHVGAASLTAKQVVSVARAAYKFEPLFHRALGVQAARLARYTRPLPVRTIQTISRATRSMDALEKAWYRANGGGNKHNHYDYSRYHGINLHSVFFRGTVEFRWFEGTLHAGEVRSNITVALAVVAYGMLKMRGTVQFTSPDKGAMRYLLRRCLDLHDAAIEEHMTKKLAEPAPATPAAPVTPVTP